MPPDRGSRDDPSVDLARFQRAMSVFEAVVALPRGERDAALAAACAGDDALRAEVAAMLRHDATGSGPIEAGAGLDAAAAVVRDAQREAGREELATRVLRGQYRLGRLLGEGGMGVVHEAEQAMPRRRVAIKALRAGAASPRALARFEQEAHILGRLSHKNIAAVHEAGVASPEDGRQAYLVLELVDGPPITEYARQRGLDTRARVELFLAVCDAIEHAHRRGVIHRDLKPSNVLVASDGSPKVLDFGVARLAEHDSGDRSAHTAEGQLVGTLAYMSPEQLSGDPRDVDTRADVWALGALLFEILTGATPVDVEGRNLAERVVALRDARPRRLREVAPRESRELEAVIERALAPEKDRRWSSAAELAADLRRWLAGEPVLARGDSGFYVLRKQVARHKLASAFAVSVFAAAVGFALYASHRAGVESQLRAAADSARRVSDVERGRLLGTTGSLLEAEEMIWREHLERPGPQTHWALWELYARFPVLRTIGRSGPAVTRLALSPDGTRLLASVHDQPPLVWDIASGELLHEIAAGAGSRSFAIAWWPDGRDVMVMDGDGRLVRWSLADARPTWTAADVGDPLVQFTAAPDGRSVLTRGRADLRLLDAATGAVRERLAADVFQASDAEWIPGTDRVLAVDAQGRLAEIAFGAQPSARTIAEGTGPLTAVAISRDGRTCAYGGEVNVVRVRRLVGDPEPFELPMVGERVAELVFHPDGRQLVVLTGARAETWDLEKRAVVGTDQRNRQPTFAGCFDADGRRFFTGASSGPIREWDATGSRAERALAPAIQPATVVAVAPDGARVAVAYTEAGSVAIVDVASGAVERVLQAHSDTATSVAFDATGARLATGGADQRIRLWDLADGSRIADLDAEVHDVSAFARVPVSGLLAVAGGDGALELFDPRDGTRVAEMHGVEKPATSVACSPDGSRIATCHFGKTVQVWSVRERKVELALQSPDAVYSVAFAANGTRVVVGTWKGPIQVWDLATRALVATLSGHTQQVYALDVHPASDLIASAASDGTVRLWTAGVPVPLASFTPLRRPRCARFAPDGRTLFVSGGGGVVAIDLAKYDAHIAGNERWQRARLEAR